MRKYVMANWKNKKSVAESEEMLRRFSSGEYDLKPFLDKVEIVFAPSVMALPVLSRPCKDSGFALSAQDVCETDAYGRVCAAQLAEFCQYTVIGHSAAKQAHGDTDELINRKAKEVASHGMRPVICVGENERQRLLNLTRATLESQLKQACYRLSKNEDMVILYEPVWAMGTGLTLAPENVGILAREMRALACEMFGQSTAQTIRFIYAGSVNPDNAGELSSQSGVDGVAVGNASLDPESFFRIVKAVYDSCM